MLFIWLIYYVINIISLIYIEMELTFDELAEMKSKIEKYICVHNQKEKSYITKKNKVPNINNIFHQSFANK